MQEMNAKKMNHKRSQRLLCVVLLQKIKSAQISVNFTKNAKDYLYCSTMKSISESAIIKLSEQIVN